METKSLYIACLSLSTGVDKMETKSIDKFRAVRQTKNGQKPNHAVLNTCLLFADCNLRKLLDSVWSELTIFRRPSFLSYLTVIQCSYEYKTVSYITDMAKPKVRAKESMITKKIIDGETYLRISDLAALSGVNIRTLQRWANAGDLVNFLTIYQTEGGINYFKLGFPKADDVLVEGSTFKYRMRQNTDQAQ